MLNGVPMKVSNQERFLGEQITGGNAESILATLKKRKGIVLMAISDIAAMLSDARAGVVGGIEAGLQVWKLAVIPFLLNSADTWIGMSRGSEDILNDLYKMFLRRILQVPTSCPIPLMFFELGIMLPMNEVTKKKLMFLFHIFHLEKGTISRELYEIQKRHKALPSIVQECEEHLKKMGLSLLDMENSGKMQWRNIIHQKLAKKNTQDLLQMMKKYKKISYKDLEGEQCELKDYMKNLSYKDAIMRFSIKAQMIPYVKCHWKGNPEFENYIWCCWHGTVPFPDQCSHIERCYKYSDLKDGLSIDRDDHLVQFYVRVIERRREEQEREKNNQ